MSDIERMQWDEPLFFFHKTSPLSNHYPRRFTVKGVEFYHREGFIMFCKAMLFGDDAIAQRILKTEGPQDAKNLGRAVRGFSEPVWRQHCWDYALQGNLAFYQQNPDLLSYFMSTGNRELVEASRYDSLWGIGLSEDDPRIRDRSLWGYNGHGKNLMRSRLCLQ